MDQILKWACIVAVLAVGAHWMVENVLEPQIEQSANAETARQSGADNTDYLAKAPPAPKEIQHIEDPLPARVQRIKVGKHGHFFLDAKVNGSNVPFLVDTGASYVALSHEAAQSAGIRPKKSDYQHITNTANGQVRVAYVVLDHVRYRNIRVNDVEAVVLPKGALSGHSLLGNSFLSKLREYKIKDGHLLMIP